MGNCLEYPFSYRGVADGKYVPTIMTLSQLGQFRAR